MLSPCRVTRSAPRCASRTPFQEAHPFRGRLPFSGRSGTAGGAICPCRPSSDQSRDWPPKVATRTVMRLPPTTCHPPPARLSPRQAALGRSRTRLPLAVTVRALTSRRGLSSRPRRARLHGTYRPCGQPPSGWDPATFLHTRIGYHRGNVPPDPEGPDSHVPAMTPGADTPEGRTPRAAHSLRGRLGLLGWATPCGVTAVRGPGYCLSTRVTPGLS
jgi:hypothetical protein